MMASVAPPTQSTAAASAYFTDLKKGEVNELKQVSLRYLTNSLYRNLKMRSRLAIEKYQCRKRCLSQERHYQEGHRVYDPGYRRLSVVLRHDNGN
jgi:hypothetical protein